MYTVLVHCAEESESDNLPFDLCPYPQIWSRALCGNRKNEITDNEAAEIRFLLIKGEKYQKAVMLS